MKVYTFDIFIAEHAPGNLREKFMIRRKGMLEKFPFSVIVDGAYFETDSLEKWINNNLGPDQVNSLFYIKTGYDFGFSEYFFRNKADAELVEQIVPNLYTRHIYPDGPPHINKSDSYENFVDYDPSDLSGIVIDSDEEY